MSDKQKYYYIAIDKQAKTIQLRAYQSNSCDAREYNILANEYGLTDNNTAYTGNRFTIFHNGTKNHIDYNTFYKKYSKFTVLEAKI